MKESWQYYEYLRRWWLLLLLGPTIGALTGLAYYSSQVHPATYDATATVAIADPTWEPDDSLPPSELDEQVQPTLTFSLDSGSDPTEEGAVKSVTSSIARIVSYTNTPVAIQQITIDRNTTDEPWWKPVVLGSVIGTLLVIGGIYVWEDARSYQRHRQQVGAADT